MTERGQPAAAGVASPPDTDVPYRELADWCVRVMRKAAERRAREAKAS